MSALTEWIPCSTPPVRAGWYDAMYSDDIEASAVRLWFDGKKWRAVAGGYITSFGSSRCFDDKWRGLASDPAKESP